MAFRTPRLRGALAAARERVITDVATDSGLMHDRATVLVAALDGLVLDALLRGESSSARARWRCWELNRVGGPIPQRT